VDWNSDGRKDLLVGDTWGYVHLFLNEGTDAAPVLGTDTLIEMVQQRAAPCAVDWNEDGKKDLLVGEKMGKIRLLVNVNTDEDPVFPIEDEYVLAGSEPLVVGQRSNPKMPDWDNDGKKDIVSGEFEGTIYFYPNIGLHDAPDFGPREQLQAGGEVLDVGDASRIDVVDWNNDGLLDILSGCYEGTIYYFEQEFIKSMTYEPGVGTRLEWHSFPGDVYTVYYSDDMQNWTQGAQMTATQETTEWIDTGSIDESKRFYKIGVHKLVFEFVSLSYESGTGTTLVWNSRPDDVYTVYYSDDLENWHQVPEQVISQGFSTEWLDTTSLDAPQRLYKVGVEY